MSARGLLLAGALALAACGPPPPVEFAAAPATVDAKDYRRVHDRWTRRAYVRSGYDTALDATVTLMSDEMRAAYAAKLVALRNLSDADRAALDARLRDEGARFVELVFQAQTSSWAWNEFSSTTSVWTVTLADDRGHTLAPAELAPLPGKPETFEALFPPVTPFTRCWRVRFPRTLPDGTSVLAPTTRALALRFAGPLGKAEVRWEAAAK